MTSKTSMDVQLVREVLFDWYGTRALRLRIRRLSDEIDEFEKDHPEVPPFLWQFVNHHTRLVHQWSRADLCIDLVVWDETTESPKLVQDLCFRDAYANELQWKTAIRNLIQSASCVWVVEHEE